MSYQQDGKLKGVEHLQQHLVVEIPHEVTLVVHGLSKLLKNADHLQNAMMAVLSLSKASEELPEYSARQHQHFLEVLKLVCLPTCLGLLIAVLICSNS